MMTRFTLFLSCIMAFATGVAQDADRDLIAEAIRTSNARALSSHFTKTVDLTVGKVEEVYSKEQAEVILTRFFNEHISKDFTIKHEGRSKLDDHFYIGDLQTSNGDYRVTFFLKKETPGFKIRQLRLESD